MLRLSLFALLVATSSTACVGEIVGDDSENPMNPENPEEPEAPTTKVKVQVSEGGVPVASLPVIFQNADDSVVAEAMTGADGTAIADMPNGGTVTIIRLNPDDANGNPVPPEVYTYVGVKAGDVLDLRDGLGVAPTTQTITVKVPANENGVATVTSACGSGTGAPPDIQVTITGCALGKDTGFYVTDGVNTSFFARGALATTVDLTAQTYKDMLASTVTVTGAGDTQISIEKRLESDGYTFFTSPLQPGPTTDITTPDAVGAEQVIAATITGPTGSQIIAKHDPFAAAPSSIDAVADMIAYTSAATIGMDGSLTWTESGPGTPDIVHASYSIAREGMTFTRMVVAPHSGLTLRLPKLPATYDAYNYLMGDAASATHQLAKFSSGYDAVRNNIFNHRLSSAAPMGGRAVISYPAGQAEAPGADRK